MNKHRFTKETTEKLIKPLRTYDKNIKFRSNINKEILTNRLNKYRMVGYHVKTDKKSDISVVVKDQDILLLSSEQILFDGVDIFKEIRANKIEFEGSEFQELVEATRMFHRCELNELILKDIAMPKLIKASEMFSEAIIGLLHIENLDLPELDSMDWLCFGLNSIRTTVKNLRTPKLNPKGGTYEAFRSMQIGSKFILEEVDFSKQNSISFMFHNSVIPELDLSGLDFSSAEGAINTFGESEIGTLNLGNIDFRKLKYTDEMFCNASIDSGIVIKSELPKLERMPKMFSQASVNKIDISTLRPAKDIDLMKEIFDGCKAKEIIINKEMLAAIKRYKKEMTNNCRAKLMVV